MTTTATIPNWINHLNSIATGINQSTSMPSGSFPYKDYTITPMINDNPHLFHNWDACPANSPKRRVGKTVYRVTKEGFVDENYFKSLQAAKKFIRNCNNR